jgi:hypothetical protein
VDHAAEISQAWPLTLARLALCGPLVDVSFLVRLLAVVQARFAGVTDAELCQAIDLAALPKVKYQKSVGLFLETVPAMLRAMRDGNSKGPPGPEKKPPRVAGLTEQEQAEEDRWRQALKKAKEIEEARKAPS